MKKISFLRFGILFLLCFFFFSISKANTIVSSNYFESPLEGRWDLTLYNSGKMSPAWLEVHHSGLHTLVGQFVGSGGSARPISKVNFDGVKLNFAIPPQWDPSPNDMV